MRQLSPGLVMASFWFVCREAPAGVGAHVFLPKAQFIAGYIHIGRRKDRFLSRARIKFSLVMRQLGPGLLLTSFWFVCREAPAGVGAHVFLPKAHFKAGYIHIGRRQDRFLS